MTPALFNHLWQSTMFAVAVALLSLAFRSNRARLRYGFWFAASIKFLVPFAVLTAAGSLLQWREAPTRIATVVASPAVRDFNAPFAQTWSLDPTAMVASVPQAQWIAPVLFGIWLCGFAAIVIRRVKQWRDIRAAVRASTPWNASTTPAPAGIEIRTAPTVFEPGVVGLRQPMILLPAAIDTFLTARQFRAVIEHEICHVRRRDNLTAAAHMVVEALFWFHPVVWWIGARLIAERERACDEHVIAETAEPIAYAEGIATVCRRYVESPLMSVAGVGGANVKARISAILDSRIGVRVTPVKASMLAAAIVVSLVVPVVAGAIEAAAFAAGQLPTTTQAGPPVDPELRFEVVSIKRFDPSSGPMRGNTTPSQYTFNGLPLRLIVGQGLVATLDRIFGWPDWIDTERYAISAKIPDGPPRPPSAIFVMIENLLKDRFTLVTHKETRELPVYYLVAARGDRRLGPALKETSPKCLATIKEGLVRRGVPASTAEGDAGCMSVNLDIGGVNMNGTTMTLLANFLTQSVGRPVIDRTGLTSSYDLTLKWTPDTGTGSPAPFGLPTGVLPSSSAALPPADPNAPNLFTAVQEQLGLKLEAGRGPVEVVVIDHIEKPTLD